MTLPTTEAPISGNRLRWSRRFLVFDAGTPVAELAKAVAAHQVEFVVLIRMMGSITLYYAFHADEMVPSRLLPWTVDGSLELHEYYASATTTTPATVSEDSIPEASPNQFPSVARMVAIESSGVVAVGDRGRTPVFEQAYNRTRSGETSTETLTRYPAIVPSGPAVSGKTLYFNIDLLPDLDRSTVGGPVRITGLPEDWQSVEVQVRLFSADLVFPEKGDSGLVRVHREGSSDPCVLYATVGELAPDTTSVWVHAHFMYKDRFCGAASRAVPVFGRAVEPAFPDPAPEQKRPQVVIDGTAESPTLTVYIRQLGGGQVGKLMWQLHPSGDRGGFQLPGALSGEGGIGVNPSDYFQTMYTEITAHVSREIVSSAKTPNLPGKHMEILRSIGFKLYRDCAPKCFKEVYWALRRGGAGAFPIQFVTDEPHIPWEFMVPAEDDGSRSDLLAVEHPVARWILGREGHMSAHLPSGAIVTVAPDYASRPKLKPLPAAQDEAEAIKRMFPAEAIRLTARRQNVSDLLKEEAAGPPVAILHFAGHGSFDLTNPDRSFIALEDDDFSVTAVDLPEVSLGVHCRTFVVFDACEVGSTSAVLGAVGGWAGAFLARRFSGFIAPLWAVADQHAATAMTDFLQHLVKEGATLGESLRQVRRQYGAASATYYSYLCYGDVMATVAQHGAERVLDA